MGNGEHTHIIGISAEVMATVGWGTFPSGSSRYIYTDIAEDICRRNTNLIGRKWGVVPNTSVLSVKNVESNCMDEIISFDGSSYILTVDVV